MRSAKEIRVAPIEAAVSNRLMRRLHYSGSVVPNSQLHFGVFLDGRLQGAMQFGPSMAKKQMVGLVRGTAWNGFLELNRMAFSEVLPRNSESRAIGVAFRLIRKHYPQIKWVLSFADGTQCGDGTIYRASGFELIGIKKNTSLLRMPDGSVMARMSLDHLLGGMNSGQWKRKGATPLKGFQLKYIKFVDQSWRPRLGVPVLPFSAIAEAGATMYKGNKCAGSETSDTPGDQPGEGGAIPTPALHE